MQCSGIIGKKMTFHRQITCLNRSGLLLLNTNSYYKSVTRNSPKLFHTSIILPKNISNTFQDVFNSFIQPNNEKNISTLHEENIAKPYVLHTIAGSQVVLPPYMQKSIQSHILKSNQVIALIRTYPSISPKIIIAFTRQIRHELSSSQVIEIATFLHKNHYPREAIHLILTSMTLNSIISNLASSYIPALLAQTTTSPEILIFNTLTSLILLGNSNIAAQLIQELQIQGTLSRHSISFSFDELLRKAMSSAEIISCDTLDQLIDHFGLNNIEDIYKDADNFTRITLLKVISSQNNYELLNRLLNISPQFIFSETFFLREFLSHSIRHYQISEDSEILSKTSSALLNCFDNFRSSNSKINVSLLDLTLLPRFSTTVQEFRKLQKIIDKSLKNLKIKSLPENEIGIFVQVCSNNLNKAIELKDAISVAKILKSSQKTIRDINLLAKAMNCVLWKRVKTHSNWRDSKTKEVKLSSPVLDSEHLKRIIWYIPKDLIQPTILKLIHRIKNPDPKAHPRDTVKGAIFWTLLKTLDNTRQTQKLSRPVERQLSRIINTRPMIEQLQYFQLNIISPQGVLDAIKEHVGRLKHKIGTIPGIEIQKDVHMKLVLSSLLLIKQKKSTSQINPHEYATIISALFDLSQKGSRSTPVDFQALKAVEILDLPLPVITEVIHSLSARYQFHAAISLIGTLKNPVDPKIFFQLLVEASYRIPQFCFPFMKWLEREQKIQVPPQVLCRAAIGFSKSSLLSDMQSSRNVWRIMSILRKRKQKMTTNMIIEYVNSLIQRSYRKNWGSRERLSWALRLAKAHNVSEAQFKKWSQLLDKMRSEKRGYWGPKHYESSLNGRTRFYDIWGV